MKSTELCLASSKIMTPQPLSTQRVCPPPTPKAGGVHTRREVREWEVNILEDARHWIGLLQYNLSNLGSPRQGLFSFHWTTEVVKYEVNRCDHMPKIFLFFPFLYSFLIFSFCYSLLIFLSFLFLFIHIFLSFSSYLLFFLFFTYYSLSGGQAFFDPFGAKVYTCATILFFCSYLFLFFSSYFFLFFSYYILLLLILVLQTCI
jgi:hypothetical protein